MRDEDAAWCEVVVPHHAKFADCRVWCSDVAPCDLFLIIFTENDPALNLAANQFKAVSLSLEGKFGFPWRDV